MSSRGKVKVFVFLSDLKRVSDVEKFVHNTVGMSHPFQMIHENRSELSKRSSYVTMQISQYFLIMITDILRNRNTHIPYCK